MNIVRAHQAGNAQDDSGKRKDEQRHEGQWKPVALEPAHLTSPRCRRYVKTSRSNGTWLLVNKQVMPRRTQKSLSALRKAARFCLYFLSKGPVMVISASS